MLPIISVGVLKIPYNEIVDYVDKASEASPHTSHQHNQLK